MTPKYSPKVGTKTQGGGLERFCGERRCFLSSPKARYTDFLRGRCIRDEPLQNVGVETCHQKLEHHKSKKSQSRCFLMSGLQRLT